MGTRRGFIAATTTGLLVLPAATLLTTPTAYAAVNRLVLPAKPKVLWMGDSYGEGVGAEPKTNGFAYKAAPLLNWTLTLDAKGGSGYCNPTSYGAGVYADRLVKHPVDAFDLVVLQGGSNDERYVTTNGVSKPVYSDATINAAITKALDTVATRFPRAQVLIMGPANPYGAAGPERLRMNNLIKAHASSRAFPYIDTVAERWFVPGDGALFAAPNSHPNNAGHALMRSMFVRDLQVLTGT